MVSSVSRLYESSFLSYSGMIFSVVLLLQGILTAVAERFAHRRILNVSVTHLAQITYGATTASFLIQK